MLLFIIVPFSHKNSSLLDQKNVINKALFPYQLLEILNI